MTEPAPGRFHFPGSPPEAGEISRREGRRTMAERKIPGLRRRSGGATNRAEPAQADPEDRGNRLPSTRPPAGTKRPGANGMERDDPAEKTRGAFDRAAPAVGNGRVSPSPGPERAAVSKPPGDVRIRRETARRSAAVGAFLADRAGNGFLAAGPFEGLPVHASGNRAGSEAGASGMPGTGSARTAGAGPDRRRRFGARMSVGARKDAPGVAQARRQTGGERESAPS